MKAKAIISRVQNSPKKIGGLHLFLIVFVLSFRFLGESHADKKSDTPTVSISDSVFQKAYHGDTKLAYAIGRKYYLANEYEPAINWFQVAASSGYVRAEVALGICYEMGQGVPKNDKSAFEWYKKAADQHNAPAESRLGYFYAQGRGTTQDDAAAVLWYQRAAHGGDRVAAYNLGLLYDEGRGIGRDRVKAYAWFLVAARAGDKLAIKQIPILAQNLKQDQIDLAHEWETQYLKDQHARTEGPEPDKDVRSADTYSELQFTGDPVTQVITGQR